MTYIYHPAESKLDKRYVQAIDLLEVVLKRTQSKYGPYRLVPSTIMTESRQEEELQHNTGALTVLVRGSTKEFEAKMFPVRIPIEKGLLGYRVFLIRRDEQPKLDNVSTLAQLKTLSIGQGLPWKDVDILRSNGFKVVTGSSYEGLFAMLHEKRFDLFSRSVLEVEDELDQRKGSIPDLAIEKHLMLYYSHPRYFWFSKTPEGKRLAARVEYGLREMLKDGSYQKQFMKYFGRTINMLNLKGRKLYRLNNPLAADVPFPNDKRYWFDPVQGK